MYYVTRIGTPLWDYHARYDSVEQAKDYAMWLKSVHGHQYEVVKVETMWTTKTLAERKARASA